MLSVSELARDKVGAARPTPSGSAPSGSSTGLVAVADTAAAPKGLAVVVTGAGVLRACCGTSIFSGRRRGGAFRFEKCTCR